MGTLGNLFGIGGGSGTSGLVNVGNQPFSTYQPTSNIHQPYEYFAPSTQTSTATTNNLTDARQITYGGTSIIYQSPNATLTKKEESVSTVDTQAKTGVAQSQTPTYTNTPTTTGATSQQGGGIDMNLLIIGGAVLIGAYIILK